MPNLPTFSRLSWALLLLAAAPLEAAVPDRITEPVDASRVTLLSGHLRFGAHPRLDQGALPADAEISYATLLFKPAAGLEAFLREQQTPGSGEYRRWLTPEQFGERFGLSRADLDQVAAWLKSQGLTVHDVARGRLWISFSGTAAQVGRAFHTSIHRYLADGETHFANATELSVPSAFAPLVFAVAGLDDFGPKPMNARALADADGPSPEYTSGSRHSLAPDDIVTIYNLAPLYAAGIDGTGQQLAVIGQTAINLSDIRNFRKRFNLPANDPQLVLVGPDPGIVSGDLAEADLDNEWSGAVARNATIYYVYSRSVRTSAQYAVDQNIAPVMTYSYGACEPETSLALEPIAQQANAQGITWMASSGDSGAVTCDRSNATPVPLATFGATVTYPASLPEITAVGGTEFAEGAGSYWASSNNSNGGSAKSYIPEVAWNDYALRQGLSFFGTGGGSSGVYPKPYWQSGPGVPEADARHVPDVALTASADHDGFQVNTGGGTGVYGGTSVSTPVFAGMVALVNHYLTSQHQIPQAGLGNINPTLYRLAQSTSDMFHDIGTGDNISPCAQGTPDCVDNQVGFAAGPGYDQATGLGSVDAYRMVTEWDTGTASTTTVTADPSSPGLTDTVKLTGTVRGSGLAPTGTLVFLSNNTALGTATLAPLTTPGVPTSTATISVDATLVIATSVVWALYSGDGVYSPSAGSLTLTPALASGSAIPLPSVTPWPVAQAGSNWSYTIRLTDVGGVASTLTGFTIDGVQQILSYWSGTQIAANGTISVSLATSGLKPPVNRLMIFTGKDANGHTWTQQLSVPFVGPAGPSISASITMTASPATVVANPQADPSCQWSHQLTIQENSGFYMYLASLTAGGTDMSSQLSQIFGTTRLAPYSALQGAICWANLAPPVSESYTLKATTSAGGTLTQSVSVPFGATPAATVVLGASQTADGGIAVDFTGGTAAWTAAVFPNNRTTSWLTLSPSSGNGAGAISLEVSSADLSPGVYHAMVTIQAPGTATGFVNVPVDLTVGGASDTSITAVANAASYQTTIAPGELMAVFGYDLAPSTQVASRLPFPTTLDGVTATVNGVNAPCYYISPGFLIVQVPYEAGLGPAVAGVNNNGQVASFPFTIAPANPGIFAATDGTLVPYGTAKQGAVIFLYITGEGDVTPTLATGATPSASTALKNLPAPRLPVSLTVGGIPAAISFIGIPSGLAGLTQINFTVPASVTPGVQPVVVTVGNASSPPVNLTVTAK